MALLKKPYLLQGIYYFITGIWPLVHIRSFMAVTGPKTDLWLVKTVGVLVAVIGATLLLHNFMKRNSTPAELVLLGTGSAIGFGIIDVYYASIDRISNIYLLDAVAQAVLILLWVIMLYSQRTERG